MQPMQPMQQPMPQPVQQNPIAQGGVQWVSGEQEARGYLIAPNSAVALWDSTAPTVYLKQADASGKPTAWEIAAAGTDYLKTAPVTSVNGKTGAVKVREVPSVTASDNGKFLRVVSGAWAAAAIDNANGGSF